MSGPVYSQDCHFFLNSFCSKGDACSFRHSAQARLTDTACYYWQNSECTRHLCPYRHSEVSSSPAGGASYPKQYAPITPIIIPTATSSQQVTEKKVKKQCFWDKQPGGCSRRHCSYLHFSNNQQSDATKAPGEIRTSSGQQMSSGSIILNREKLQSLKDIIPINSQEIQSEDSRPRRVVVPPATGMLARREVTGGIKTRLGVIGQMKDRLGSRGEDLSFASDGSRDESPDLEIIEELRTNALKSIDLRNRIDNKVISSRVSSESPEILQYESDNDQRRSRIRQEKREKKARKKKKKAERENEKCQNTKNSSDLPSASDYSDLDTPAGSPDPFVITAMSRTAGMYADTKAINKSAKIRLGKRKANRESLVEIEDGARKRIASRLDKFDLTKPRRGSLDIRVDRNPSPPRRTAEQIAEAKYRTIYSRSPSPPSPRLKKRRRSEHRSRSPSPPSSSKPSKISRLTDEDLMAMDLSDLQELISKKKKVKTKKNKKEKDEKISKKTKEGKKKEDKKSSKKIKEEKIKVEKKKKKLKKKESRSDSSPSPSPPPVHSKKRSKSVADDLQIAKPKKAKVKDIGDLPPDLVDGDLPSGLVAGDPPSSLVVGDLTSGLVAVPSLLDDAELEHQMKELLGE